MKPGWNAALEATFERYCLGELELLERSRLKRVVVARQYFWLLLKDQHGWSYPEIAKYSGDYNHTTVLNGCRRARRREAESNAAKSGVHEAVPNQEAYHDETG